MTEAFRGHLKWNSESRKFEEYKEKPRPRVHSVITDDIPQGIQSMASGKWYTSKARLREEYKALGLEEVGNEIPIIDESGNVISEPSYIYDKSKDKALAEREKEQLEADVATAYTMVRDGMAPLTEFDKERAKIINKQIKDSPDGRVRPIDTIE